MLISIFPPPPSSCRGDDGNRIPGEPSGPNASHVLREASRGWTFAAQLPALLGLPFPAPLLSWGDRWEAGQGGPVPPRQGHEETQAHPLWTAPRQHIFWQVPGGLQPAHRISIPSPLLSSGLRDTLKTSAPWTQHNALSHLVWGSNSKYSP